MDKQNETVNEKEKNPYGKDYSSICRKYISFIFSWFLQAGLTKWTSNIGNDRADLLRFTFFYLGPSVPSDEIYKKERKVNL